jgi:hypothetical protein
VNDSSTVNKAGPARWFDAFARDVTSQSGEDGILERIFDLVPGTDRWCCEFGAWDGKKYSNTYNLIANKGWHGILIEADARKHKDLLATYAQNDRVTSINKFVRHSGPDTLDHILADTAIPRDFDLLSIDIDGNDYHVWQAVQSFSPKVVIIEFNQTIPNNVEFVQKADPRINHGNSLLSLVLLGKQKGYELVAVTNLNTIFVQKKYFNIFGMTDNSLDRLRPFSGDTSQIFQLQDGTIVVTGCTKLLWQNLELRQESFQIMPKFLRVFPPSAGPVTRFLQIVWRQLYRWRLLG